MVKAVTQYKSGDFIFAKVKGYPAWPARIQAQIGNKYFVYFYGTGETANLPPNTMFDYSENKDKFLRKVVKRKDFKDGVKQIEHDFANNGLLPVVKALERGPSLTDSWESRVRVENARMKEEKDWEEGEWEEEELCAVKEELYAGRDVKHELYAGHEVKDELVLGPTALQPPDAAFTAGLPTASVGVRSHVEWSPLWRACSVRLERLAPPPAGRGPRACGPGGARPAQEGTLARHIQRHGSGDSHVSSDVPRACSVRVERLAPEAYTCERKRRLARHIQRHDQTKGEREFPEVMLAQHLRGHLKETHECEICKKQFSLKKLLHQHNRTEHEGVEPCKIRSALFEQNQHLVVALQKRTRETEMPYKCEICMRQFSKETILLHHLQRHETRKPVKHTCEIEICMKQFTHKDSLKLHKRYFHCSITGEKTIQM